VGKVREINQDAILALSAEDCGLFAVADGMGGHSHGEKASGEIVRALRAWWEDFAPDNYDNDFKRMMRGLMQTVEKVNREIYRTYNRGDVCGSTVVILFLYAGAYGVLCAGDSRVYLYHDRKFRQLTIDDVWENQADLTDRERRAGWNACHGKLVNAVGIREEIRCRMITDELKTGMVFLLCSDGLYKYCPEQYLKKYMKMAGKEGNTEYSGACLLDRVRAGEAKDNISIVLVQI
jgi:serine/threonine protein phosphatase PrpC